jgi:hypothetical protein
MNIRRNVNLDGVERVAYNDAGLTATEAASAAAICYLAVNGTISGQNVWAASRARTDHAGDLEAAPYRLDHASRLRQEVGASLWDPEAPCPVRTCYSLV